MKKLLALICVMLLMCSSLILPSAAATDAAVETYTSGDFKYIILPDQTLEITEYTNKVSELTIPVELDGMRVTSISRGAFWGTYTLTSVTIPDSVTHIRANPFYGCDVLATISVSPDHPSLVVSDGVLFDQTEKKLLCYPCTLSTSNYTIPQGTLAIGDNAFSDCYSLVSVTIPDSVTSIGGHAFSSCDSLTSVFIPDSVTSIGDCAFSACDSLTSITIPDSVTFISFSAFYRTSLTFTVPRDSYAEQWCKDNNYAYTYSDATD